MRMKYIQHGALGFVLWPDHRSQNETRGMDHVDMALAVRRWCKSKSCTVISAGFAWVHTDRFGKLAVSIDFNERSESLQMGPLATDALDLLKQLGGGA